MFNPLWNKTITLFTQIYDEAAKITCWHKWEFENCFYKGSESSQKAEKITTHNYSNVARIPLNSLEFVNYKRWDGGNTKKQFTANAARSVVFLGKVPETIPDGGNANELLKLYEGFEVESFADNSGDPIPHYRLGG